MGIFGFGFKIFGSIPTDSVAVVTAPGAPVLDSVTKQSCALSVDLVWHATTNGGSAITGYKIERKIGAGSYSTLVANTGSGAGTYTDTLLTVGTLYTYRISAINAAGTSAVSNELGDTTNVVAGSPTALTLNVLDHDSINLSWSAPASDGGCSSLRYKIERENPVGGGFATIVADTGNSNTTYSDNGLSKGVQYNYRISTVTGIGVSAPSVAAAAYTNAYRYSFQFNGVPASANQIAFGDIMDAIWTTGVFSIVFGIRVLSASHTKERAIFQKWGFTGNNRTFQVAFNASNNLQFRISPDGAATALVRFSFPLTDTDKFYLVRIVYDRTQPVNADRIKCNVDGVDRPNNLVSGTFGVPANRAESLKIGVQGVGDTAADPLNAYINFLAVTSDIVTDAEMLTLYNGGKPLPINSVLNNIQLWIDLDGSTHDGTNFTVPDLSGNSRTGTSANMSALKKVDHQNFYE